MTYRHEVRVRYADCDMQGVVYNAHYLTFVDDACDCWLREVDASFETNLGWEVMLKKAEVTWHEPGRFGETLEIECDVTRWGNTSFDIAYEVRVGERHVVSALVTYVTVDHEHYRPVPIPGELRDHFSA